MEKRTATSTYFLSSIPTAERLWDDLEDAHSKTDIVSFLCYDIHSLRKINRTHGRKMGDALLAAVAKWTLHYPKSALYRIEGDQFCVMFAGVELEKVHQFAINLEARFGRAWHLCVNGRYYDIYSQASIAILGDLDCDYREELLDLLEQALEVSRKEQQIILFNAEHDRTTRKHVRLQMELKNCIHADMEGFSLNFQPLASPVTGTWCGLEALCRWTGPTTGPVPPAVFIVEAEEMGLMHTVGDWVLHKALETCKALGLDEIDHFFVSVNVSAQQIKQRHYVQSVLDALEKHRYPASKLALEITESTQLTFNDLTMKSIQILRMRGVVFALDDFGTGYSGFSNLKHLPVDILKTDREFIEDIETDTGLQYFYYIMSETAHTNSMQLIAEGIETRRQLQSVVKNGADLVQGYLFGRPMDSATLQNHLVNFSTPLQEFTGWMTNLPDLRQWVNGQAAYKITPSLFGLQNKCIRTILDEANIEDAMDKILEAVGVHFKVSHVYLFLHEEGTVFSEAHEWCAEGIDPQKHLFQKIDVNLDGFYDALLESEVVLASSEKLLPSGLRARLETAHQQGTVRSLVAMPMKRHGEILGFVGFDHSANRDWMPEELIILHSLCLLCLIVFEKKANHR